MVAPRTHTPEELLGPLNEVETKHAPKELYSLGDLSLFERGPRVSVVGTRKPSELGARRATLLADALVDAGLIVVSGLAEGIDTIAHQTALECGGSTIAVIGTPLDQSYPASNRELQARLAKEQLVVSQFPSGTPARRQHFPMRNRTMALLSDATVIVEAGASSGTRHQGWEALRLGRLLFLLESLVARTELAWPQEMIRYGAQVLGRNDLADVLGAIPERARDELAY